MKNQAYYLIICLFCSSVFFSCQEKKEEPLVAEESKQTPEEINPSYHTTDQALFDTIMALDEEFWKAWSTGDTAVIKKMASENIEFYHDRGGLRKSKEDYMNLVRNSQPNQGMTRSQALKSYTIHPAYGSFMEGDKGTIEVGKLADFTVFDKDIMTIPEEEILNTSVEMTIIGGEIKFKK